MSRVVWLLGCTLVVGCGQAAGDAELSRLREEVAALRSEVDALRARVEAAPSRQLPRAHAALPSADVTLSISTTPPDAKLYIDGQLVAERTLKRAPSHDSIRVRIEKTGFRIVEQTVVPTRSHRLHYALSRGRGVVRKPAAR